MPPLRDRTSWLFGEPFRCLQPPASPQRPWHVVLLGPPGVGKGTQATLLSNALGACPLSTGDLFRAASVRSLAPGSAMAEARQRMNRGELVPDDVVLGVLRERRSCLRCSGGFLLDGFPRTAAQAIALDGLLALEHLVLDAVISYELPLPALVARAAGRRVCCHCQAVYHVTSRPPAQAGVCDHCGRPLVRRADDEPTAVRTRLDAHAAAAAPVDAHYERLGLLIRVDASDQPEVVCRRTLHRLAARGVGTRPAGAAAEPGSVVGPGSGAPR